MPLARKVGPVCRLFATRGARALLLAAALISVARGGPPPVFVDPGRGVKRQREAAEEAAKVARQGGARASEVLDALADVSAWVRDRVVETVVETWPEEDLHALLPGLGDRRLLVREAVCDILSRRPLPAARRPLEKLLTRNLPGSSQRAVLAALESLALPASAPALGRYHDRRRRSPGLRAAALRALDAADPALAAPRVERALREGAPEERAAALDITRVRKPAEVISAAVDELERAPARKAEPVPRALYRALRILRAVSPRAPLAAELARAVGAAIARLQEAPAGRERWELEQALVDLTGEVDIVGADSWLSWWRAQGEGWRPAEPGERRARGDTAVARVHGVPIHSRAVVFLQDISGGMARPAAGEGGASRLDAARAELARVLTALDDAARVRLVYFASAYTEHPSKPSPLRRCRRELLAVNAAQQIPRKPHSNRGNIYDPLVAALREPWVDTVVVLTEGAPTEGRYVEYEVFERHFQRIARDREVRVEVIRLGEVGARTDGFLRRLAEFTGGLLHAAGEPAPPRGARVR